MIRQLLSGALIASCAYGLALLAPSVSHAAEPAQRVVRVGFVSPFSPSSTRQGQTAAFWERLHELGWVEGQNLIIETRWAEGRYDRLPVLMAEVLGRKIDVFVTYGTPAAIAAKNATSTVPIVVAAMGDPVGSGVAASLAHPGGNLTGFSQGWTKASEASGWNCCGRRSRGSPRSRLGCEPGRPARPRAGEEARGHRAYAGLKVRLIEVREPRALAGAFERAGRTAQAVLVLPDPILSASREQSHGAAAKHRLPAIYTVRDFVDAGLMAYSPDLAVLFRRAADYVDRILRGAKPGDLPIEQPTEYRFVVNLKAAKALGMTIPESILFRADEVIR